MMENVLLISFILNFHKEGVCLRHSHFPYMRYPFVYARGYSLLYVLIKKVVHRVQSGSSSHGTIWSLYGGHH